MTDQRTHKIAAALSNEVRQRILEVLGSREMTAKQVHESIHGVKYRDTIFRHLELLKEVGILSKHYDDKTKQLKYRIIIDIITIRLLKSQN